MAQNNKNRFDNIDVDIRRAADGKTNGHGEPPWPLASWADSSYLTYGATTRPQDLDPHGNVRARVVGFLDREAAREAASSSDRPARSPAHLQRRRVHETRRSELAVATRDTSSLNVPAGNTASPVEGIAEEAPTPRPFEFRETPAQTVGPGLQSAAGGTMQAGAGSVVERSRPDYLDGMVGWMRGHARERGLEAPRSFGRGGCGAPRPTIASFGLRAASPSKHPHRLADAAWPYSSKRLMVASMEDVNAISGTHPSVHGNREQRRKKAAARKDLLQRLRDRHRSP
ncbi:hypothetical protein MMC17_002530 [Xylographa soralifera]|nr:hypothetical protein [Xylographa soralifera]